MSSLMITLDVGGAAHVGWTPEAVDRAVEAGLLDPAERFEIIDGELYSKMGQSWPHRFAIDALIMAFDRLDLAGFHWSVQTPLKAGASYPEPDFHVLHGSHLDRTELPKLADALFVVEVSDTSLSYDLRVKVPLYAQAGVPVFWLVDITRSRVVVHTQPVDGEYLEVNVYEIGDGLPSPFHGVPSLDVTMFFGNRR